MKKIDATVYTVNATNKNVTWQYVNSGIASVNTAGYVTGVSAGTTKVIATTQDGSKKDTCNVVVNISIVASSIFTT